MLCRRDFLLSTTSELRVGNALLWYSKANLFLQQITWEAKMEAEDIERYLAELGTELKNRGLNKPVHVLLIGGAYMLLLANAPRSTKDIDIFWLDEDGLQRAYAPLRESVQIIKQRHNLDADWLNYLAQMLMYDEVIVPDGKLWKRFGPLHVYAPPREYILALKIAAGRDKDLADCAILLSKTRIRTREQAQHVVERYLLPGGLEKYAQSIEHALRWLFEGKRG
jgi:hypothetical protein